MLLPRNQYEPPTLGETVGTWKRGANQKVSHRRAVDEFLRRGLRVKIMAKFDLLEAGSLDGPPPSTIKHEKNRRVKSVILSCCQNSAASDTLRAVPRRRKSQITTLNATYAKENTKQKSSSLHLLEVATIRKPFSFRKNGLFHVEALPQQGL